MSPRTPALVVAALALACRPDKPARTTAPTDATSSPSERTGASEPPPRRSKRDEPAKRDESSGDAETDRMVGITAAHNRVRAPLKLPPLVWSSELARFAQSWADKLAKRGCRLQHRPRSGADKQKYGENIFSATGQSSDVGAVVDAWAEEVKDYSPKTNRCKGVCGHYTQIVWRASRQVGCGMATCGDTEVWVCNYDPPGNFVGQKPY